MTEYSQEQHNEAVNAKLQPAVEAYKSYLRTLQVDPEDIEEYAQKAAEFHGKGMRKAEAFVQFINGLLKIDL